MPSPRLAHLPLGTRVEQGFVLRKVLKGCFLKVFKQQQKARKRWYLAIDGYAYRRCCCFSLKKSQDRVSNTPCNEAENGQSAVLDAGGVYNHIALDNRAPQSR